MKIQLFGMKGSRAAYEIRDFLVRSTVSFDYVEVSETDAPANGFGMAFHQDELPVCVMDNGDILKQPDIQQIAERLGWITRPNYTEYDVSIYGAGPAGLSAAVYAASEGLKTVLVEKSSIGGQAGSSSLIENFLGYPEGIAGAEIAEKARQQAVKFGADILHLQEGVKASFSDGRIHVDLADGGKLIAKTNICATGVEYQHLNLPREGDFLGRGLFYGAGLSEAYLCREQDIYVVGGANSAGQAAVHFADFARSVTMVIRGATLSGSMSRYLIDKLSRTTNIRYRFLTEVVELDGDGELQRFKLQNLIGGEAEWIESQKLFVCIGGKPNTEWAKDTSIIRDESGYLVTGPDIQKFTHGQPIAGWTLNREPFYLETSIPGSFAVGDVRHNSIKRMATAVGEGAMCITFVHKYLRS